MVQKAAFATALELWAQSRERAITDASKKASALASRGYDDEAEHFRFVARLLTVRAMHEKSEAAALRAADAASDPASSAHTLV
jgi:hypothetical protein